METTTITVECGHCGKDIPLSTIITVMVGGKPKSCCAVCATILSKWK